MRYLNNLGVRRRITDFRKGQHLGARDHLVQLEKPKRKPGWMTQENYDSTPDSIIIRELKVKGKTLITTLLSPKEAPKHELKSLYKKRWHVELIFVILKPPWEWRY